LESNKGNEEQQQAVSNRKWEVWQAEQVEAGIKFVFYGVQFE
jgi:hypothetical protein